jgi:hypothetical protein
MGSCHHLAVAMHRMTGWDLALIAGNHRGEESVFHVFCIDPDGSAWDARGKDNVSSLVDEQVAMDGCDAWPVRLSGEAEVWSLARAGKLYPIHQTHILNAIEAVDEILGGEVSLVSDGWHPKDPAAVEEAASGQPSPPRIDRESGFVPESAVGILRR